MPDLDPVPSIDEDIAEGRAYALHGTPIQQTTVWRLLDELQRLRDPRCYAEWTPTGVRIVRPAYVTVLDELPEGGYTDPTYVCARHGNTLSRGPTGEWGHRTGYVDEFLVCPPAQNPRGTFARAEGVVRYAYSDAPDAEACVCCPGRHVYGRTIEGIDDAHHGIGAWLYQQWRNLPDGTRIVVTAGIADLEPPPPPPAVPFRPDWTVHPGEVLKDGLAERGMSQNDLAGRLGHADASQVSRICNGRADINTATALGLEEVLGIKAEVWLRLQISYDLHHARRAHGQAAVAGDEPDHG